MRGEHEGDGVGGGQEPPVLGEKAALKRVTRGVMQGRKAGDRMVIHLP